MYNLRERVAILIDFHDIWKKRALPEITFWSNLNDWLLLHLASRTRVDATDLMHMGTWMFVQLHRDEDLRKAFSAIDNLHGYIVHYGLLPDNPKGIDVNLVCQMLLGAFEDRYDSCILFSDDLEFEPAVHTVQNMYGKRVFHAGFQRTRLRAACFGNFALEEHEQVNNIDDLVRMVAS